MKRVLLPRYVRERNNIVIKIFRTSFHYCNVHAGLCDMCTWKYVEYVGFVELREMRWKTLIGLDLSLLSTSNRFSTCSTHSEFPNVAHKHTFALNISITYTYALFYTPMHVTHTDTRFVKQDSYYSSDIVICHQLVFKL